MDLYDHDDTLDRAPYLLNDHDDYNTYSLDWPENVFGEELPTNVANEATDDITFNEEVPGSEDTGAGGDAGDGDTGGGDTGGEDGAGGDQATM